MQRIFAHKKLVDSFIENLSAYARKQCISDPTFATTDIGPLIRPAEVERVHAWVTEAKEEGA